MIVCCTGLSCSAERGDLTGCKGQNCWVEKDHGAARVPRAAIGAVDPQRAIRRARISIRFADGGRFVDAHFPGLHRLQAAQAPSPTAKPTVDRPASAHPASQIIVPGRMRSGPIVFARFAVVLSHAPSCAAPYLLPTCSPSSPWAAPPTRHGPDTEAWLDGQDNASLPPSTNPPVLPPPASHSLRSALVLPFVTPPLSSQSLVTVFFPSLRPREVEFFGRERAFWVSRDSGPPISAAERIPCPEGEA
jgi:hypothetical protein